jgi:hypothetical protein
VTGPTGATGATGPTGTTGPTGPTLTIIVQEGDTTVDAAVTTLDFGNGLDVISSPAGEANVVVDLGEYTGTDLPITGGGTGASDAATARTNLGLAIGTNVQAYDAELAAIAGLTSAADKGIQFTGAGTAGTFDLTAAGKALLDDADAAAQRTTLGLGSLATLSAITTSEITDNTITYSDIATINTARFVGRVTAGVGNMESLTGTQATTLLDAFTSSLKGLTPASGGGTANFLRADGTWTTDLVNNAVTGSPSGFSTDTYISGSLLDLSGKLKAGTVLMWRFYISKTAAGTAAPIFRVRMGANGSTADAALVAFTGVNQTAAADKAILTIQAVVRSVSATATVGVDYMFSHANAITGFANSSYPQIDFNVSGSVDTTAATLKFGVSINAGASANWTISNASAQAFIA